MDPVTGLLILGTGLQVAGGIQQGKAAREQGEEQNRINQEQANLVLRESKEREQVQRVFAHKQIGEMVANIGASGITMEGSPMDYIIESVGAAERDALSIRVSGQEQARAIRMGGSMALARGKAMETSSYLGAAGSLLSGGANAWYTDKKLGG